jgi:hypothetical protein
MNPQPPLPDRILTFLARDLPAIIVVLVALAFLIPWPHRRTERRSGAVLDAGHGDPDRRAREHVTGVVGAKPTRWPIEMTARPSTACPGPPSATSSGVDGAPGHRPSSERDRRR